MSDTNTLDGMSITQLRELARRAEAAAKVQEAETQKIKERDKYTVSAAVNVNRYGALICVAKDGTRWFTVNAGAWVIVTNQDTPFGQAYEGLAALGVFPYQYENHDAFCRSHRPTYSGVRK